MGQYNPHRPSILGQEWAPVREMPFQLDTETERGVTFVLDHAATVVSGAVYIDDVPASAGSSKGVMLAVYEAGTEHLTGPIQRVVIPPISGFWRSHDGTNPLDVDIDPPNITFAQALEKTNDYGKVNVEEDGAIYVLFDTSSVSAQLAGKRILELNLLYAMSGTQSGVPGALPDLAVSHNLYVQQGNPDTAAQYFIHQGSPEISLLSGTIPKVSKARLGNSMIFDMEQFCGTVPFWKGSAFFPLRNDDLARFDTGNPVSTRMAIEFDQSDGCSGCTSVSLPDNRYTYMALEVIYCEERRLLYGGRGVWPCANWLLDYGQNRIMLKPPDTFGLTGRTLTPGEYTVTVTMADMGDAVNNTGGNYSATGLLQKYPLDTHTGLVIDTRPVVGQTFSRATSDLLPRVTLHTASGVVTGVHDYDTLTAAPVYDSVDVAPDVVERSGGAAVQYPQVRFYARRFGDTNVALVLRRQSAPTTQVSISAEDFDALPEIVDGWREVTLRFTGTIPTMSDNGATQTWEWVADGLDANNQWEILVPYGESASSGVFDTSRATYGGALAFTQVGSSSLNSDADATLIFSQDPPAVTGFAVEVAEQSLEPVGEECALEPACIPTALYYHHLTWNARDVADLFDDRSAVSGWAEAPSGQVWSHSGGTLDDYFVVSGAGHMQIDSVNTLYTSSIEAQAYNVEVHGVVRVPVVPAGASVTPRVVARQEDANNNYEAQLSISTAGVAQIYLVKRVAGVGSIISAQTTLDGVHAAGDAWHIVLRTQADTILAQAWKDGYPRPLNWQSVVNTLPGDSITGTQAGASFRAETGFSSGTIDVEWLEFSATNLDVTAFEVQRRDEVDDEWQTIMLSTGTAVNEFNDYEARVGIESEYRIRTVNALDFYGPWTSGVAGVLDMPGGSGNYASTPDAASLDITGDIDVRVHIAPDDWTPSPQQALLSKYNVTADQRSWQLILRSPGQLEFSWSTAGTGATVVTALSTVATGFPDGTAHWVRATLATASGTVTFYTSEDGGTWTQLGATVVSGATSIFSGTATVNVGARSAGTTDVFTGLFYSAEIRNGIDGTIVANPYFDEQTPGTTSFADSTGKIWTLNGTAVLAIDTSATPGTSTLLAPGVVGNGPDGNSVLIFTTNEVQDGSSNLAYVMVWTSDITEEFTFPEANTVQLRDLYRRDFPMAFHPLERGGERFQRDIIVQNAAVPSGRMQDGFRSLRDLAWDEVPYVCVRNELGDRWLSTVLVPNGRVQRNRRLYIARIEIIQTTETPSPVDPTGA